MGLLSIGEEETKGNDLTREAFPLLKALPINFIGNVEGRDIFNGQADVIVCDGFVGNVALKTSEGVGRFVRDVLRESLTRTVTAQVGALLSRRAFNEFRRRLDYTRIRRRAAAGRARRVHHRPRLLERRAPSITASAWPTSLPRQAPTSASSRSSPAVRKRAPRAVRRRRRDDSVAADSGQGHGQWTVDSGQWTVDSGQWTVVRGQESVIGRFHGCHARSSVEI